MIEVRFFVGAQRWAGEDRTRASEARDAGSIPAEGTKIIYIFYPQKFADKKISSGIINI